MLLRKKHAYTQHHVFDTPSVQPITIPTCSRHQWLGDSLRILSLRLIKQNIIPHFIVTDNISSLYEQNSSAVFKKKMQFLGITMHRGAERTNQIIPIQGTYAFNATRRVYLCKGILTSFTASSTASLWNISYPDKMGSMHDDLLNQHPMKHPLVLQFNMNGWENSNVRCPWLRIKT